MSIDRRTLISLAFSLAFMGALVIWYRSQPKPVPDLTHEAGLLQLAGKYKDAIQVATQAIDQGKNPAFAHFIRASCLYQQMLLSGVYSSGELDQAEEDYRYALMHTDQQKMKDNCIDSLIVLYELRVR